MNKTQVRFTALDVFRGLTVCFMVIVISPGSGALPYWLLDHAPWHGFTPTDLVFPSFLFAVGNALSFSEKKFSHLSARVALPYIFKRGLIIFLLGYLMGWFPFFRVDAVHHILPYPITQTRILGVLQRIAICYVFIALAVRYIRQQYLVYAGAGILLLYWAVLLFWGSPDPFSLQDNVITKLDLRLFGPAHLYFDHGVFDPEGLLSTLPAIVNTLVGYLAGKYLQDKGSSTIALRPLFIIGFTSIVMALLWNTRLPINKKLWTSSFSLLTIGIDLLLLPLIVIATDDKNEQNKGWIKFFTIFGKNPLVIYMLAELFLATLRIIPFGASNLYDGINNVVFQAILPGSGGSLLFALSNMLFCWSVGWILNKNKIYIKV